MIDGFGLGVGFSGKTDDTYLGLYEQQQRTAAMQEQQRQKALADAAENQDKAVASQTGNLNKMWEKVDQIYVPDAFDLVDKFTQTALELKAKYPTNFTQRPEFMQSYNETRAGLNKLTGASQEIRNLRDLKPEFSLMPQYRGLQEALQLGDRDALNTYFPETNGLATGRTYYKKVNPVNDILSSVESLNFTDDNISVTPKMGGVEIKKNQSRNPETVKRTISDYYDANAESLAIQNPQWTDKNAFVNEMFKQMPKDNTTLDWRNTAESKSDGDGNGKSITQSADRVLKLWAGLQGGNPGMYNQKLRYNEGYQLDGQDVSGKEFLLGESLRGTKLGKVTIDGKTKDNIVKATKLLDGVLYVQDDIAEDESATGWRPLTNGWSDFIEQYVQSNFSAGQADKILNEIQNVYETKYKGTFDGSQLDHKLIYSPDSGKSNTRTVDKQPANNASSTKDWSKYKRQ